MLKNTVDKHKLGTTLRVAGGWVRDKLYGRESEDIDIAIDNMQGKEFAEILAKDMIEYELKKGYITHDKTDPKRRFYVYKSK